MNEFIDKYVKNRLFYIEKKDKSMIGLKKEIDFNCTVTITCYGRFSSNIKMILKN